MSATQLKNGVRPWHEELLEFLLANPRASLQEISFHFSATPSWISIVKNSDAFKEMWAKRRQEHFDRVSISVTDRVTALADVTIDALTVKMEQNILSDTATIEQLKEVGDMALKALGFGAKQSISIRADQNNTTQNVFVDKATLERAREARRLVQSNEIVNLIPENTPLLDSFPQIIKENGD